MSLHSGLQEAQYIFMEIQEVETVSRGSLSKLQISQYVSTENLKTENFDTTSKVTRPIRLTEE